MYKSILNLFLIYMYKHESILQNKQVFQLIYTNGVLANLAIIQHRPHNLESTSCFQAKLLKVTLWQSCEPAAVQQNCYQK